MPEHASLVELLANSAKRFPDKLAVVVPGEAGITYSELEDASQRLCSQLVDSGIGRGDRVGFRLHKSIDSVASLFGILKAGAAYVPVDADSPVSRGAFIFNDCGVKLVIAEADAEEDLKNELARLGSDADVVALDRQNAGSTLPLLAALDQLGPTSKTRPDRSGDLTNGDLAYLLYTSGSTGNPKGVALSHGNALSFVEWCSEVFTPSDSDRFSSHAPFHFDLSILDIFVSIKHGATLVLIGESLGKDPLQLSQVISDEQISIWYSTPSILSLLANYGKLDKHDFSALRLVFFAGEVFPIPQYLALREFWKHPRFVNLYGPTETNVCTWYEVPQSDTVVSTMSSFPIGEICEPNLGRVINESGEDVAVGEEGELIVLGPNVMQGYWNLEEQSARAFLTDSEGKSWYKTGDVVRVDSAGCYTYSGRRDRMVKRRGYRVELGEIEVALSKHPDIRETAAVAMQDEEAGVQVWAYVVARDDVKLSIIGLKGHASQHLPPYMIPDRFSLLDNLPRTSTDKIDYQTLKSMSK